MMGSSIHLIVVCTIAMLSERCAQPDVCQLCENGGQCPPGSHRCQCPLEFTGVQCETAIDHCQLPESPQQCRNNAQCVDGVGNYSCLCLSGWEGRFCDQETNECQSSACRNGGSCEDLFDGFRCVCPPNYTGVTCGQDVDECAHNSSLCHHGATCLNTVGGFTCSCVPGYTGTLCQTETNECDSSPCHFNGSCTDLINNFRCQCMPGYLGARCEAVVRQCQPNNPCGQQGLCLEKPQGGHQCFCKPGYYGDQCQLVVNLCASQPCSNGATCVNGGVNYSCTCAPGLTGHNCETDVTDCADSPCLNNGTCTEVRPGSFVCQCPSGFKGSKCETKVNECDSNPCQERQACISLVSGYRCECRPGTTGSSCETDTPDCRLTACVNGGTCSYGNGAYVCECPAPFTGLTCSSSLDPCTPNPCLYGGSCYRVNGTAVACACPDGFIGPRCQGDVYECLSSPCLNGGTCIEVLFDAFTGQPDLNSGHTEPAAGNTTSGRAKFTCSCPDNYTGLLCEQDYLACSSNPCQNGGSCTSHTKSDYLCKCANGWTGDLCEKDLNECLIAHAVCLNDGQCINRSPGFSCVCPKHWTGKHCDMDILECESLTCLNGGTCSERSGNTSFCVCPAGYTSADCSVKLSRCDPNPCLNNATCRDVLASDLDDRDSQSFTCQCLPGFTGPVCEGNIDECTILKPCFNNATCLDAVNGYVCQCPPGWTGLRCQANIDDCLVRPCLNGANCTDLVNGFRCTCDFGYAGANCSTEVNECSYSPCRNNASCVDSPAGFTCQCQPGFTGVACSQNIDDCVSSPCGMSATCVDGVNTFTCLCPPGFQGSLCDEDVKECSSRPCQYGGTCLEPVPAAFVCVCPPGLEGATCETISTANFDGRTALTFTRLAQLSNIGQRRKKRAAETVSGREAQVQFTVTTSVLDGILLVATGVSSSGYPQNIVLELRKSVLHVSANNGLQLLRDSVTLTNQNTAVYSHMVQLTIKNGGLDLRLDPSTCDSKRGSCLSVNLKFDTMTTWYLNGAVHFGGVANFTAYLRSLVKDVGGFTGCLGNFMVNGQLVNLADAAQFAQAPGTNGTAPAYGCETHVPCQESVCAHGGACQDLWVSQICDCLPGFSGPACGFQNMAHFENNSMLHFNVDLVITELDLWLSAADSSGLILYTVAMDALSLSLDSGQLMMHLILHNSSTTVTTKVGRDLHLQDWVRVSLKLLNNTYTVQVSSDMSTSLGSVTGHTEMGVVVSGSVYLGALLKDSLTEKWRGDNIYLPSQSIQGCIRDVAINRSPLDLSANTPHSDNDLPQARPGCSKVEACLATPCGHGACVGSWQGPGCKCEQSYTGDNCSQAAETSFLGNSSYSWLQLDRTKVSFGESGSIQFRTRDTTSTLMLLQFLSVKREANSFILFAISGGNLYIYSSISNATVETNSISDGQWHSLLWIRNGTSFDINLDSSLYSLQTGFDPFQTNVNSNMEIIVGARPQLPGNLSSLTEFFKGCMRGIYFNNVSIPFSSNKTGQPGLTVSPLGLLSGCQGDPVCDLNSCPANSFCVDEWNAFDCHCLDGWDGVNCAVSVNDCINNSCRNGASCQDEHLTYTCQCLKNYSGQFCETTLDVCNESVCNTNNTESCVMVTGASYTCNCLPGYTGRTCEVLLNPCDSHPCVNNATCVSGVNNFTCVCRSGFSGAHCQTRDSCECFNGGTCLSSTVAVRGYNPSDPPASDLSLSATEPFTCQCVKPYIGSQCQNYDYCDKNLCRNNFSCVLQVDHYLCNCSVGFTGVYCEKTDFCASKPCLNNGTCNNRGDLYTCSCPVPYTGANCETRAGQCTTNACLNGAPCFNNSLSLPSSESSSNDSIICLCNQGQTGQFCETDVSKCALLPCLNNGTCVETPAASDRGYVCACVAGFQGDLCETNVRKCNSSICLNGGTCIDLINNFTCTCAVGFTGRYCELDLRGCASSPCQNLAVCTEANAGARVAGSYTCECFPDFTGKFCETNIDDCLTNMCANGAACKDGVNNYTCICLSGYSGQLCNYINDSCYTQPCSNKGVCSYRGRCSCSDIVASCGWTNEPCQVERCQQRQECTAYSPSYVCNCTGTGYTGVQCLQDVDECLLGQDLCQHGGQCVNALGNYTCDCSQTGYHGNLCDVDNDECAGKDPCFNGGTCVNLPGSFQCGCSPNWQGKTCGENINDCLSSPCNNGGQCRDEVAGYSCDCSNTGYEGINCSQNVDDCGNNRCENGGQCQDGVRQYSCLCNGTGYLGEFCQTKPTGCQPPPCLNNGTCSEADNMVACNCTGTGFSGTYCQTDTDECSSDSHHCKGNSTCVNVKGSYFCQCSDSRTGQFCELTLTQNNMQALALGPGAIAALVIISLAVIVIVVLLIIFYVKRRRKTRGRYKPAEVEGQVRNGDIYMNRLANNGERVI